jgi:hypothetical protein
VKGTAEAAELAAIRRDIFNLINQMTLEELLQARIAITRIRLATVQAQLERYEKAAACPLESAHAR